MVKLFTFFFLFLFPFTLWSEGDIKLTVDVDSYSNPENAPIKGTLQVTHDAGAFIDPLKFTADGKPLSVVFIKEVKISSGSPLMVSIYSFELPGKAKGLYVLPEISLTVGSRSYQSIPATYEVNSTPQPPSTPSASPVQQPTFANFENAFLKLEAKVDATPPIYPGQRFKFVYTYFYKGAIELKKESLPLLDAEGFLKVGSKELKDSQNGDVSILQITQEVEAIKPGEYSFGASTIEGVAYQEDSLGRRQYSQKILTASVPPLKVIVTPFPVVEKPASFSGAVGQFTFGVSLLSPRKVNVGDKVQIALDFTGKTSDWSALNIPELCCQPGFSGLFEMSDLPPVSKTTSTGKQFIAEIRPLSPSIKEIPSIEFSYFDPDKKQYVVLHSDPIPLTVLPLKENEASIPVPPAQSGEGAKVYSKPLEAIEIYGIFPLTSSDLSNEFLGDGWSFLLIPFGVFLIMAQLNLQKSIKNRPKTVEIKTSEQFFKEALDAKPDTAQFYDALNQAFICGLREKGEISAQVETVEMLPSNGLSGEIRSFLLKAGEKRFTGQGLFSYVQLVVQAKVLFEKLKER